MGKRIDSIMRNLDKKIPKIKKEDLIRIVLLGNCSVESHEEPDPFGKNELGAFYDAWTEKKKIMDNCFELILSKCKLVFNSEFNDVCDWDKLFVLLEENSNEIINNVKEVMEKAWDVYIWDNQSDDRYTRLKWRHDNDTADKDVEDIINSIKKGMADERSYSLRLVGNPGTGKTETLKYIRDFLLEDPSTDKDIYNIFIELIDANELLDTFEAQNFIRKEIEKKLDIYMMEIDVVDFFNAIGKKVCLYLDGYNEVIVEDYRLEIRDAIEEIYKTGVTVLLTDRPAIRNRERLLEHADVYKLAPMTKESFYELISKYDTTAEEIIKKNEKCFEVDTLTKEDNNTSPIDVLAIIDYVTDHGNDSFEESILAELDLIRLDYLFHREIDKKHDRRVNTLRTVLWRYVEHVQNPTEAHSSRTILDEFDAILVNEEAKISSRVLLGLAEDMGIFVRDDNGEFSFEKPKVYRKYFESIGFER